MNDVPSPIHKSLFEEDFLRRTLGEVVHKADVALMELVANAWDAGALEVDVQIPESSGGTLTVRDDGCGLDAKMFAERWMKLAYNRTKHQGGQAEWPPGRSGARRAYGRNGQGRHALLCFADSYLVTTWREGAFVEYLVAAVGGDQPFVATERARGDRAGHGTILRVDVTRNLPDPDRIRDVLAAKFLHDPRFQIRVNGQSVPLAEQAGLIEQRTIELDGVRLTVTCVEGGDAPRLRHHTGVAFWVGRRLVGEPGWTLGRKTVLDGRTRAGRRLTFVVQSEDLYDEVLPDWTGFRATEAMEIVFDAVHETVEDVLRSFLTGHVAETRNTVIQASRARMSQLSETDQVEVAEIVEAVTNSNPLADPVALSEVVREVVAVKERRSPEALVQRVMQLPPEDIDGLHRLLDEWTVRDALTVLDEVGRRLKVIESLDKLMGDKQVDELQVLHPLVAQARWLFGPEFDSPTYASNVSIRNAVNKVFKEDRPSSEFQNPRKRPDLLVAADATVCAVATEDIDLSTGVARLRQVLLIELKRGGFKIGRKEVSQAAGYVDDLLHCGLLDGTPHVFACVVGHEVDAKLTRVRKVGDPEVARIEAFTYGQLVRTAERRLFRLRDQVEERYPERGLTLVSWLQERPEQLDLLGVDSPRS